MFVSFSSSLPLSLFLSHTLHVYVCMCVCISVFKNRVIKSPSFSHLYICLLTHSYSVYMLICYTFWSIDWMMMDRICISKWYEFSKLHQKKNHTSYLAVVWVLKMVGLISFFLRFSDMTLGHSKPFACRLFQLIYAYSLVLCVWFRFYEPRW